MYMGNPRKCMKCHKEYRPMGSAYAECPYCAEEEAQAKRKAHFETLDKLPLEERIRKIEEWIYDYKPPKNWRDIKY